MDLTQVQEIDGKKLTQPEKNLLAKLVKDHGLKAGDAKATLTNVYSGVQREVDALPHGIVSWILTVYRTNQLKCNGGKIAVNTWDRTRHFVVKYWPEIYYDFVD
jgi:hypothetical protein